jgi:hypothetical protein
MIAQQSLAEYVELFDTKKHYDPDARRCANSSSQHSRTARSWNRVRSTPNFASRSSRRPPCICASGVAEMNDKCFGAAPHIVARPAPMFFPFYCPF